MNKKKKIVLSLSGCVLLVFSFGYWIMVNTTKNTQAQYSINSNKKIISSTPDLSLNAASTKENPGDVEESIEEKLVRELMKKYSDTISLISVQVSLYDLRNNIRNSTSNGLSFFYKVIKRAFPSYADEIIATLNKLDLYNQWLDDNESMFSQLSDKNLLNALWDKRIALFGENAYDLWDDERLTVDISKLKFRETVDIINKSDNDTIEEKFNLYHETLDDIYADSPELYRASQSTTLCKAFFSINAIQNELKQMEPDERQLTINNIRRGMGASEEQVEKMEQNDIKLNGKWDAGSEYMKEREILISSLEGEAQKTKLTELRERYFRDEAKTIEMEEEKNGFFRFNRPRYYGRN